MLYFVCAPVQTVSASAYGEVTDNEVLFDFPDSATFSATISASTEIVSVVLEYGSEQLSCGEAIAKAFPQFTAARSVDMTWKWDMRQSGSLPPGARLWWRWRYIDASGQERVSETITAVWLDDIHDWQNLTRGYLHLHWYQGDQTFAHELVDAAQAGLDFNSKGAGLIAEAPIDVYIYSDVDDLQGAILYEPSWTGGLAFPEYDIVILGIAPSDLDWGRDAIVHELTHVLVGHLTFSCLGDVPTWLNEGLAVYSEGELDYASQIQLNQAIQDDSLLSVRSLSGSFSEVSSKAYLSYSQSYSLVKFLVERYGQEKMTELLVGLRDGDTIHDALDHVYGFDVDGLEDAWRKAIGARPRHVSAQPTLQPTPTHVPTIVPIAGSQLFITPTPYSIPTSSFTQPGSAGQLKPTISILLFLGCLILLVLMILGVIAILVIWQKRKGGNHA